MQKIDNLSECKEKLLKKDLKYFNFKSLNLMHKCPSLGFTQLIPPEGSHVTELAN